MAVTMILDSGLGVRGEGATVGEWIVGIQGYQEDHAYSLGQRVLFVDLEDSGVLQWL